MTTQPPPWPGDDRPHNHEPDNNDFVPPAPGHGQAREQVRPEPLPPPPMPAVYGQAQPQPYYQVAPKNPALGVICSVFIPGLGSMIAGKGGKGALILILNIVGWITVIFVVGWFLALGTWIWGMVAGYQDAQKWNRDHGIISLVGLVAARAFWAADSRRYGVT